MLEKIIFYLLLVDSLIAFFVSVFGQKWYIKHMKSFSRILPISPIWTFWYLLLVLWIGFLTF